MKAQIILSPLTIIAFGLFACGGDPAVITLSGESTPTQVDVFDDLPNCNQSINGSVVETTKEKKAYICTNGHWEFDHDIVDSIKAEDDPKKSTTPSTIDGIPAYESEDDMPNCTESRQGNLAIAEDNAQLCDDGAWQDLGTAYTAEDSLPACNKKSKDNSAFVIKDRLVLFCDGEKWRENTTKNEIIEEAKEELSSSSSDQGVSDKSSDSSEETNLSSSSQKEESPESSANTPETITKDTIIDPRDGKAYKTVKIGNQIWFAENLNYDDHYSVCPMEEPANCDKYGRLYIFQTGLISHSSLADVCPDGWRLPDSLDWAELINYVETNNGGEPIGVSLKATTDWYSSGDTVLIKVEGESSIGDKDSTRIGATKGTDRFGFSALPAGSCWESGCYVGDDTRFFMTAAGQSNGFKLAFDKDELIYDESAYFGYISVRCIQNQFLQIDSLPPSIGIDTLVWMKENLSYQGSDKFTYSQSLDACPKGWRLPTWEEFAAAVKAKKMSFPADEVSEYFVSSGYYLGYAVSCAADSCTTSFRSSSPTKSIRCVYKQTIPAVPSSSPKDPAKEESPE
ncbi:MAG: hypothetical protein J6U20_01865 [Fibrobacter sp.]|nr:hypothetical protein [Fibrobacter sp.]